MGDAGREDEGDRRVDVSGDASLPGSALGCAAAETIGPAGAGPEGVEPENVVPGGTAPGDTAPGGIVPKGGVVAAGKGAAACAGGAGEVTVGAGGSDGLPTKSETMRSRISGFSVNGPICPPGPAGAVEPREDGNAPSAVGADASAGSVKSAAIRS